MRQALLGLVVLAAACFPPDPPPKHAEGEKVAPPPECTPVATLRYEAEHGSLGKAAALFAKTTPCDAKEGAIVIASMLVDLARYEDALRALERTSGPDVEEIRTRIAERRAVRSPEVIAAAAAEFKRGLSARDPKDAEARFMHAWTLDAPNGQALLHAAMRSPEFRHVHETDGAASPEVRDERMRVLRLFERAEAELGVETGTKAHAGLALPPVCVVHSTSGVHVRFLPDSLHGAIDCSDASMIFEIGIGAPTRVAQWANGSGFILDPTRLPRLRWIRGDGAEGFLAKTTRTLSAPPTPVTVAPKEVLGEARVLKDGTTAFVAVNDANGLPLRLVLFSGGKEIARVPQGYDVHDLDDGRIAVRASTNVVVSDRAWQKRVTINGGDADVSADGLSVLYTSTPSSDESRPPVPWMRPLADEKASVSLAALLAPAIAPAPATLQWTRVGPVKSDGPGFTIHDRTYAPTDELACIVANDQRVFCMDPAGPVEALDPFADGLVCRVGPHVLPLGACPSLVVRK